ncbi:hypothetical protein GIB67_008090 [Kingdonia uniflora]|uniref:Uncharacterized protein n=1 Tax=Kingdonia uniflora TaxID=39325 RepID=A0A7J7MCM2_9MAGN|nr:hypothetical protein GIB67_008090 [Kingdonia uniflora]
MGNSLRCCLACVLPCGALDVIRIVHMNGQVDEITNPISASEVLKVNPNHVLSKPCSQGVVRRILILSPDSDLKRGNIYFLTPASSVPEKKRSNNNNHHHQKKLMKTSNRPISTTTSTARTKYVSDCDNDAYLTEILSEQKTSRRDRRYQLGSTTDEELGPIVSYGSPRVGPSGEDASLLSKRVEQKVANKGADFLASYSALIQKHVLLNWGKSGGYLFAATTGGEASGDETGVGTTTVGGVASGVETTTVGGGETCVFVYDDDVFVYDDGILTFF